MAITFHLFMCFFLNRENAPDQLHLVGSNALFLVFVRGVAIEHHGIYQKTVNSVGRSCKKRWAAGCWDRVTIHSSTILPAIRSVFNFLMHPPQLLFSICICSMSFFSNFAASMRPAASSNEMTFKLDKPTLTSSLEVADLALG